MDASHWSSLLQAAGFLAAGSVAAWALNERVAWRREANLLEASGGGEVLLREDEYLVLFFNERSGAGLGGVVARRLPELLGPNVLAFPLNPEGLRAGMAQLRLLVQDLGRGVGDEAAGGSDPTAGPAPLADGALDPSSADGNSPNDTEPMGGMPSSSSSSSSSPSSSSSSSSSSSTSSPSSSSSSSTLSSSSLSDASGPALGSATASVRVVVCGGDGSLAWVLQRLAEEGLAHLPSVVIPLGTGNDMSNVLGWGNQFRMKLLSPSGARSWLRAVRSAASLPLDLWEVDLRVHRDRNGRIERHQGGRTTEVPAASLSCLSMNYCSLGLDARLVRHVERYRQSSRIANRVVYALAGAREVLALTREPWTLALASLALDGRKLDPFALGSLHSLILLNIASYGGGTMLWPLTRERDHAFYERLLGTPIPEEAWARVEASLAAGSASAGGASTSEPVSATGGSSSSSSSSTTTTTTSNGGGGLPSLPTPSSSPLPTSLAPLSSSPSSSSSSSSLSASSALGPLGTDPASSLALGPYIPSGVAALLPRRPPSAHDGRFEVVGARTLFQLGSAVGSGWNLFGGVHRIAQAKSLELEFLTDWDGELDAEIDGEAFTLVRPASFRVTLRKPATVLHNHGNVWER